MEARRLSGSEQETNVLALCRCEMWRGRACRYVRKRDAARAKTRGSGKERAKKAKEWRGGDAKCVRVSET